VYPEYDQLVADGKLTVVVMFGEIDDGPITESETGMRNWRRRLDVRCVGRARQLLHAHRLALPLAGC
jgi:hypothetical protein